jgi:hypothetical protein
MQVSAISKPSYESILAGLEQVLEDLPSPYYPRLIGELERLKVMVQVKLIKCINTMSQPIPPTVYLTVDEVVEKFHVSRQWLYRHKKQMPHSQPSRKVLLFPEQAVTKWFASRRGP